jgi:hypothetical protein
MPSRCNNPEARAWLTSNYNPSAFATNEFQTTARALAFVFELYAGGAREVLLDNIAPEVRPAECGPYADSLIVRLSGDARQRRQVIEMCERAVNCECGGTCHERSDSLYLWWD